MSRCTFPRKPRVCLIRDSSRLTVPRHTGDYRSNHLQTTALECRGLGADHIRDGAVSSPATTIFCSSTSCMLLTAFNPLSIQLPAVYQVGSVYRWETIRWSCWSVRHRAIYFGESFGRDMYGTEKRMYVNISHFWDVSTRSQAHTSRGKHGSILIPFKMSVGNNSYYILLATWYQP
jgi:hypothetical protein